MDVYDSKTRSRVMRAVPSKNTSAEMRVRRLLHRNRFRYRLHAADLPGKPDIIFRGRRKAIFVHGCFWHQHPGCPRAARPSSNTDYWRRKLDRNVERDVSTRDALLKAGWTVLVLWECELRDEKSLLDKLRAFIQDANTVHGTHFAFKEECGGNLPNTQAGSADALSNDRTADE